MKELLIGANNRDKGRELEALLAGLAWRVRTLNDFPGTTAPEEDGATFEANALLKARYYGDLLGIACVADDSGLAVDALGGEPGVYSARYAGPGCGYADNNRKLLSALEGLPVEERGARFVCCAAYYDPIHGDIHIETGEVRGSIAEAPSGASGFGYDPVFIPEGSERTFAEFSPAEKHAISHRGRAFGQLRRYLERAK